MDFWYILGQILGIVAIALGFISYQVKTKRGLLLLQSLTSLVFCIHYGLIGAFSGMAMNSIGIFRNVVYERMNNKRGDEARLSPVYVIVPVSFALVQGALCILTWEAWYSVFVFLGIIIHTLCISFRNPQNVRKSILVTSPLVCVYDILANSIGGAVYETVAVISSIIGIARFKRVKMDSTAKS